MTRRSFIATASVLARSRATEAAASSPTCMMVISTGDPLSECDLAGSRWIVTAIGEQRVSGDIAPTIEFRSDGRVFGTVAINRYTMDYVQDGWNLSVGLAFATRFAGDADRAEFETEFLQTLETIRQFRRDEQTLSLIFETHDGREIRTRPVLFR